MSEPRRKSDDECPRRASRSVSVGFWPMAASACGNLSGGKLDFVDQRRPTEPVSC
jgi:hypothetical protein